MLVNEINPLEHRTTLANADQSFVARWSPRAFSRDVITPDTMATLIEAARWAPSCFNAQPWRFAAAYRDTQGFDSLLDTLAQANQTWACAAGALVAVISRTQYERNGNPAPTHSFDTGAAWMSLAMQAHHMGLITHGMQGFDQDAARQVLQVPDIYDLPAIIAVGYPGDIATLDPDLQVREIPSDRKSTDEILFTNTFGGLA